MAYGHCDSNPAQYERNRRFGHLVHALGRSAGGAKLPSAGLCLNASKAASYLDEAMIFLHFVRREAEIRPLMVGSTCSRSMNVVLMCYSCARFVWGEKSATFMAIIQVMLVVPTYADHFVGDVKV
jgi:hypothetical protein